MFSGSLWVTSQLVQLMTRKKRQMCCTKAAYISNVDVKSPLSLILNFYNVIGSNHIDSLMIGSISCSDMIRGTG